MRRRLLLSTVGIAVVAIAVLGIPIAYLLGRVATDEAEARLSRQASALVLAIDDDLAVGRLPSPATLGRLVPQGDQARVSVSSGPSVMAGKEHEGRTVHVSVGGPSGSTVELSTNRDAIDERVQRAVLVLLGVGALGVAAATGLALLQSRRLVRPLDRLAVAAGRLGAGDFSTTAPRSGVPEFDAVATSLDASAARIAELVRAEREFSANASHQLRSALTGLSLHLEELSHHPDPEVREEADAAAGQAARLSDTVEQLLALARTGRAGARRTVDLAALVAEHAADWRPRFAAAGRTVTVHGQSFAPVRATPGTLGQAIDVLLDNALRHGAGRVGLDVAIDGSGAQLVVSDEGPGIDPAILAGLFQRGTTTGGSGIGLSLARTLVEADGGSLELVHRQPATFRVHLPGPDVLTEP